jgi:hypothetical protein
LRGDVGITKREEVPVWEGVNALQQLPP